MLNDAESAHEVVTLKKAADSLQFFLLQYVHRLQGIDGLVAEVALIYVRCRIVDASKGLD